MKCREVLLEMCDIDGRVLVDELHSIFHSPEFDSGSSGRC